MTARQRLLSQIAEMLLQRVCDGVLRVAVDGVDGAGKTIFADELAEVLQRRGQATIRASVDGFHNPRAVRYQRGRQSPEGFFYDSYNYDALKMALLDPLSPGGSGRYRVALFDHRTDAAATATEQQAAAGAILVLDGIFLHRDELRSYWDFSIFLDVGFEFSIPRCAARDGSSPDPQAAANHRYVAGQQLYLQRCQPREHATLVVNNEALAAPFIVTQR